MKHGPGRMATGGRSKLQGTSRKLPRGASLKPQAPSLKLQASSDKLKSFLNLNPISRGPGLMAHGQ
jgi:hypothetical protein